MSELNGAQALPRQTFKTEEHTSVERMVAEFICQRNGPEWTYAAIGSDHPDREKSRVDGAFLKNGVITCFAEIKGCGRRWSDITDWTVAEKKVVAAQELFAIVRVPVLFIVRFNCGTIARLNALSNFTRIPNWGRTDRNSPGDVEVGARYRRELLTVMRENAS